MSTYLRRMSTKDLYSAARLRLGPHFDDAYELPVEKVAVDSDAHEAAASPHNDLDHPSEEQQHAGNYKKGHINVSGVRIAIENPAGSRRRPEWSKLVDHYGYINLTRGADGEHIDCFVRVGTQDDYTGPVYVVDQIDQETGEFDEHKICIGVYSKQAAIDMYLRNFTKPWKIGKVTKLYWHDFVEWVKVGWHEDPIAEELK